ncbi:hypothetical protein SK1NUM_25770 [Arachnia rubra]|nr:hypothetical protein SK1NUM_25770 [Arachnia rubra]
MFGVVVFGVVIAHTPLTAQSATTLTVTLGQLTVGREVVAGGALWVLWTPLKNGISRLLAGFDSIPVMDVIGDAVPKRRVESFVIEA